MATSLADQCVLCMLDKNQKAQTDMVELSVASDFGFITSGYSTAYCTPICSKEICNCDRNAQKQVSKEKKVMQTLVILKTEVFLILLPSLPVSEDFLTKSPKSKCRNGLCSNLSRLMCVVRSPRCCITAMVPLNHCCILLQRCTGAFTNPWLTGVLLPCWKHFNEVTYYRCFISLGSCFLLHPQLSIVNL